MFSASGSHWRRDPAVAFENRDSPALSEPHYRSATLLFHPFSRLSRFGLKVQSLSRYLRNILISGIRVSTRSFAALALSASNFSMIAANQRQKWTISSRDLALSFSLSSISVLVLLEKRNSRFQSSSFSVAASIIDCKHSAVIGSILRFAERTTSTCIVRSYRLSFYRSVNFTDNDARDG